MERGKEGEREGGRERGKERESVRVCACVGCSLFQFFLFFSHTCFLFLASVCMHALDQACCNLFIYLW